MISPDNPIRHSQTEPASSGVGVIVAAPEPRKAYVAGASVESVDDHPTLPAGTREHGLDADQHGNRGRDDQ